tara:strand:+ start:293 stop:502 length:210 start_codon:yes stop_codon:yes gene_type:complete
MSNIEQIDMQNPDHFSIITKDDKVIVSAKKKISEGLTQEVGFVMDRAVFNTNPPETTKTKGLYGRKKIR